MTEYEKMQIILQLKIYKLELMRTYPNKTMYEINTLMREDEDIKDIMGNCGRLFV